MDIWSSLTGMVGVKLVSADLPAAMRTVSEQGIDVYYARIQSELNMEFAVRRSDLKALTALVKRRGDSLQIDKKRGLYWTGRMLLYRPVLVMGILAMLMLSIWLPSRVIFVQVEGNASVPSRLIAEMAAQCGVGFGASRREIRSEKVKNVLLENIPQLKWAGVNTKGCVAVISVREGSGQAAPESTHLSGSIVAVRDGVISEMTVLNGTPLCKAGQAVKAGQVLIGGYLDRGICLRVTCAQGEIFAKTGRTLTSVLPTQRNVREQILRTEKKYAVVIGKKRINFFKDSGISDATCVRIKTVEYITLPGGFSLPMAFVTEELRFYDQGPSAVTPDDADEILKDFAKAYLISHMVAGTIEQRQEVVTQEDAVYRNFGHYACHEMIGKTMHEEISNSYGENN